jgi:hypothetical protein
VVYTVLKKFQKSVDRDSKVSIIRLPADDLAAKHGDEISPIFKNMQVIFVGAPSA